jgi:ribulose-phosphate 3-epimerase
MESVMPKLQVLRAEARRIGSNVWLQVDGGVTLDTIVIAAAHGADTFVAGSSVYNGASPEHAIAGLRSAVAHHH